MRYTDVTFIVISIALIIFIFVAKIEQNKPKLVDKEPAQTVIKSLEPTPTKELPVLKDNIDNLVIKTIKLEKCPKGIELNVIYDSVNKEYRVYESLESVRVKIQNKIRCLNQNIETLK
jgi:FtsZ-interacting cell division protein ZipA